MPHWVKRVIAERRVDAVIHFAGSIVVPESVAEPLRYYQNNVVASRALMEACIESGVKHFIFSSTSVVYAEMPRSRCARASPNSPSAPMAAPS